jgi:DNA-binding transcriptional LysR family regulator
MIPHAKAMSMAAGALKRAGAAGGDAEGKVRITASEVIGVEVLPEIITGFMNIHPHIHVELALTSRTENLLKREADIAIRMKRPRQEALIARKIGDVRLKLYAHSKYISSRGMPESLNDIEDHVLIGPESLSFYVDFSAPVELEQLIETMNIKSDSDLAQLAMVRAGCGIGGIQTQLAARDKMLLPVLHDAVSIGMEMWLAAHSDMLKERPIRLFYDFLAKHLGEYVKGKRLPVQ